MIGDDAPKKKIRYVQKATLQTTAVKPYQYQPKQETPSNRPPPKRYEDDDRREQPKTYAQNKYNKNAPKKNYDESEVKWKEKQGYVPKYHQYDGQSQTSATNISNTSYNKPEVKRGQNRNYAQQDRYKRSKEEESYFDSRVQRGKRIQTQHYEQKDSQYQRNNNGRRPRRNHRDNYRQEPRFKKEEKREDDQGGFYKKQGGQGRANFNNLNKYMESTCIIEADTIDDKLKKIKKAFLECYPDAKDIKVYYSKLYPMLIFEYFQSEQSNRPILKHFGDILRETKVFKVKRSLFQEVFERLFNKVDKKFYNIAVFLLHKGRKIKSSMTKQHIFNLQQGSDVMFYYMKGRGTKVNFIVFDCFLRYLELDNLGIEELQHEHPDQFKVYLNFRKKVIDTHHSEIVQAIDIFDKEQISSDQDDRPNFEERPLTDLKRDLQSILNKNLTDLQTQIDNMTEELIQEGQRNPDSTRFRILEEKTQDMQAGLDMYNSNRDEILGNYTVQNQNSKQFVKRGLKKMIIAEKQLESGLPIIGKKMKIFDMLKKQNLLIIEGETGSGKSTQLPQILCEYYKLFDDPKAKPVLVTQPRRLATRTLAERVAKEMGQTVGGFVDYVASSGKDVSMDAKIIFKLDRIVLDELTEDPILSKYSCLVIDQAHERTISIDVILGLIKTLLERRNDFKIIVTSASMDIKLFESHFNTRTLRVSGRMYPVTEIYRDYKNYKEGDKFQMVAKIQKVINQEILTHSGSMKSDYKGHLLCFCSQINEIEKLVEIFSKKLNSNMFAVYPLHGKITPADQKKVFQELGKHKLIFASRIAQTAITIDGVKVVIDPGKDLELIYDQKYKYSSMKLQQITKSSAKQRKGRAGRTGPGFVFRLYSQDSFRNRPDNKIPQIQNSSLELVVLRLKTLKIKDVVNFHYISSPSKQGLMASLELLKLIGTLTDRDQEVTKIGHLLVKIPIEPFLSRAIVESMIFQKVLRDSRFVTKNMKISQNKIDRLIYDGLTHSIVSILALVVNFSSLFYIRKDQRQTGDAVKYQFSDEEGDFFFLNNIYKKFKTLKAKGNNKETYKWVNNNFLSFKALNQTQDLIQEILKIADNFTIDPYLYEDEIDSVKQKLRNCENQREVILSCLLTSFSPNICKFSGNGHLGYTMVSQRKPLRIYGMSNLDLIGKNPEWIVCYDLHTNQSGRLYCKLAHQITYDFMRKHLDSFVWRKFSIQKIHQSNPFYKTIVKNFPTKIIQQFKFDYNKSESNERYQFLKNSYPLISQEKNKVTFFIQQSKGIQSQNQYEFEENLAKYECQIINNLMSDFRHNYIGNVFACLFDGFQVRKIQFDNQEFCFEISGPSSAIKDIEYDSVTYGRAIVDSVKPKWQNHLKKPVQEVDPKQISKIKVFIDFKDNREAFQRYLYYQRFNYPNLMVKQTLIDKRRKIPKTKIFIHYFAGTAAKNNLYAHYDFKQDDPRTAGQMCQLIKEGVRKGNYTSKLKLRDIVVTRSGNGINFFTLCDEYQIAEDLHKMDKKGLLTFQFKMPQFIRKYRQPQISEAQKSNDEWREQIEEMLEKVKVKKQNIIINIWGSKYKPDSRDHKGPLSQLQKTFRIDMRAEVITLDNTVLQKLRNKYDGRQKVIGCQKVHIRAKYEQLLATCTYKAFESLIEEYEYQVKIFNEEFPLLMFEPITKRIRNIDKTFLYAYSPNRQDFVKPMKVISALFLPKLLKLEYSEFRFLSKMSKGAEILEDIEYQYKYQIYFGFDNLINSLRIYCQDGWFNKIETKIKQRISQFKYFTQKISYRGKNLNKVKKVIQQYQKNNPTQKLEYEIQFGWREIVITTNIDTFQNIKNNIMKLVDAGKAQCNICADTMKTPYRLMICGCEFCWLCLAEHVRMYKNSSVNQKLCCPNIDCKQKINIFDVKTLISEEEYQKLCDIKISKYLEAHRDIYMACKYCENVFDRLEVEKDGEINCQICGKIECLKCNQSHTNYTCEEWKNKDNLKETLNKMGVKQCPTCKAGILKNGGCNHVQCTSCSAHICWKCFKVFDKSNKCYDHLAKDCGGIFDPI